MELYRICKSDNADDLSGEGAAQSDGRWNHKGTKVLYLSGTRALATLEVLVHADQGFEPDDSMLVIIGVPDDSVSELYPRDLPEGWNKTESPEELRKITDRWIAKGETLVLKVPSAVVQGEFNFLVNPAHERFGDVRVLWKESYEFDERLL